MSQSLIITALAPQIATFKHSRSKVSRPARLALNPNHVIGVTAPTTTSSRDQADLDVNPGISQHTIYIYCPIQWCVATDQIRN